MNFPGFFTKFFDFDKLTTSDLIQIIIAIIALFGPYIFEIWKREFYKPKIRIFYKRNLNQNCIDGFDLLLCISNLYGNRPLLNPQAYLINIQKEENVENNILRKKRWRYPGQQIRSYKLRWYDKFTRESYYPEMIHAGDHEFLLLGRFSKKKSSYRRIFSLTQYEHDSILEMLMNANPKNWFFVEPGRYRFELKIIGDNNFNSNFIVIFNWFGSYTEILNNPNKREALNIIVRKKHFWNRF
ncbi:MAG: hypothetical protein ACTSWC_03810 [Promethearchaeota archaeon]